MTAILIAENDELHKAFARRVVSGLWADQLTIHEADCRQDALRLAREHGIDYAILDLQLVSGSGVDVARMLWSRKPETRVLFWTNFADEAYVRSLDRIVPEGTSYGYLLKSADESEMRATIEAVFLRNRRIIDRQIRAVQSRVSDRLAGLSDTEYEGLVDIALGLTDRMIAKRRRLSVRGVQNRLRQLYEKLEIAHPHDNLGSPYNSRTRSITLALERGLLNFDVLRREQDKLEAWLLGVIAPAPTTVAPDDGARNDSHHQQSGSTLDRHANRRLTDGSNRPRLPTR